MPPQHVPPAAHLNTGLCLPHPFLVCEGEMTGSLNAARCSMASHHVAGSASGLGHQMPPRSPPVPSAKSRAPKLLSHWGAAPGTGQHQVLLAETHRQKFRHVGVAHPSETLKQPSSTPGRVTCVPAQAEWHGWALWLVLDRGPASFSPGRGARWLAPCWQYWYRLNMCPIVSALGLKKPAWAAAGVRGCAARCCAWRGRGLGLCCHAWGTPGMFWEAPKGGCGERCPPSFSAPALPPHAGMLVIT